jgi:hypothetical protein
MADIVANCCKSLLGRRPNFSRTADAFRARRYEGPHRFAQNDCGASYRRYGVLQRRTRLKISFAIFSASVDFRLLQQYRHVSDLIASSNGRVEMWRGGFRSNLSVAASFVWRCLTGSAMAPFPHPAHRSGRGLARRFRSKFGFPVVSPFRLRVSHYLDHATSPAPSASHATCGFPALRAPICFTPTLMGPILLGQLSARRVALDRR